MKTRTQKIVMASMLAALTCVATMIIKIPSPVKGYINLGDCVVLLSGWIFSPLYAFLSAGIGSALADILSGYAFYAPATFIIKGVMAVIACVGFKLLIKRTDIVSARLISGITSEIFMVAGYFIFESFLYGIALSALNIPANGVQGIAGLVLGLIITRIFEKNNIIHK
ncbi:MAG: ECF transporter S component [Clostridia bacterium]|nr:ECF transporter S component [Clostridia bacterium]